MPFDFTTSPDEGVSKRYETAYDKQFTPYEEAAEKYTSYEYPKQEMDIAPSKYDEGFLYNVRDPYEALNEQRAQQQSGIAKLGLGLSKALVLTGTTALDGIIGTAVGAANMGEQQELSALWDNPFSRSMNAINDASDEWMPIYQTKDSKNASFIGQMGYADFWGDKFLKNLGFTAGMIIDGMITGGASMEVLGAKALASKLPTAIASAAMKGDKALGLALQAKDGVALSSEVIKNAKRLAAVNRVSQGLGLVLSTQGESRFEALTNSTQFYNDNKKILDNQLSSGLIDEEEYTNKLKDLSDAKDGMGNTDFLANTVILGISNGIQFKNLFTKGFNPNLRVAEGITGTIGKGYKYSTPVSKYLDIAKNPLAEGIWEEQGQYAAQKASEDFYQKRFNGDKQDSIDDVFHSVYKGLSEAYGTREGWNQGLIGSLTGMIGLPTVARNQQTGNLGVTMASGIWGDISNIRRENEYNQIAVDKLNETLKGESFQNNYQGLIRNLSLEEEKLNAVTNNDKHEFLNKEHEQFINNALTFIRADKYEDFIDNIKTIKNSNSEEVRQLFMTKPKTVEDSINEFYGLKPTEVEPTEAQKGYIDIFKDYTSDEMIDKINRNADSMLKDAENIRNLDRAYSTLYPNISNEAKERLIYFASNLDNVNKRIDDLNKESISKFGLDINDNVNITTKADKHQIDISEYLNLYNKTVRDRLDKGEINPTDIVEFTSKLADLPRLLGRKATMIDAYKKITTGKGLLELETQIANEKVEKVRVEKEEGITTSATETTVTPPITTEGEIAPLEAQDLNESINEDEYPTWQQSPLGKRDRGLKEVATSLSHSHTDPNTKKTVVRNEEFNEHVSTTTNDLKGDEIDMQIDTSLESNDPNYADKLSKLWNVHKDLKSKLDSGVVLTQEEASALLNKIRITQGNDNFDSFLDIVPIKANYTTSDGKVFDKGLYYHDSNYNNIFVPIEVRDKGQSAIDQYVTNEKEKTRGYRKAILMALLTGKSVTVANIKKSKGIPNYTDINRNIDEVLNMSPNQIKLGIATSNRVIYTGEGSEPMVSFGTPGSVFFETNRTANGEVGVVKTNVQKLSKEHAEILWNAILTRHHPSQKGYNAVYPGNEVEGLTVGEVIALLANMGPNTNLDLPKNKGKLGEHLRGKQLFVDSTGALHYGNNIVKLVGGVYLKKSGTDVDAAKKSFIEWATTNKNYSIRKNIKPMGIELNKPMTRKFKLGSWVSDGTDTYAGSVIKQGLVKTNVSEFKNTGSLFHAPVTILDLSQSGLIVKLSPAAKAKDKVTKKEVDKAVSKPTNKPSNTGGNNIKTEVGNKVMIGDYAASQLRALPVGTNIYMDSTWQDDEGNVTSTPKLYMSVIDKNGSKYLNVIHPGAKARMDLDESKEPVALEFNDDNIYKLHSLIKGFKDKMYMDTSKSIDAVKTKKKKVVTEPTVIIPKVEEPVQPIEKEITDEPTDLADLQRLTPKTKPQIVKEEESTEEEKPFDINDLYSLRDAEDAINDEAPFRLVDRPIQSYPIVDLNKELKWLNDKLGSNIPVEVVNGLIEVAKTSKKAFGMLRNGSIILSNVAAEGTIYHEAFHAVNLLYRTEEERQQTYNEARKRWDLKGKGTIKKGIDEIFNSTPELSNIGTKEQYSKYLDSIFPESKLKDIVYHGTGETFDVFKTPKELNSGRDNGIYFTSTITEKGAEWYAKNTKTGNKRIIHSILDVHHIEEVSIGKITDISDGALENYKDNDIDGLYAELKNSKTGDVILNEYAVFEPSQIHILGSKQDISKFKEYIKLNPYIKASDREVEEFLAEKFREYVSNKESNKPTGILGKIGEWFKKLYTLVKNIFTGDDRLSVLDIDKLFESIQSSKYRSNKPLQDAIDKLGEQSYNLEVKGINLENILTTKQYRSVIRGLASIAMKKTSERLLTPDNKKYGVIEIFDEHGKIKDLDLNDVKVQISTMIDNFNKAAQSSSNIIKAIEKKTLTPEVIAELNKKFGTKSLQELATLKAREYDIASRRAELWEEIYNNYESVFRDALRNYIANELNIREVSDTDEDISNKEINNYDKAAYEYSAKQNILHSIKFLISNLHASEERNEFTGMREFVQMDEIWSRLMADLHMENNIDSMLKILESKTDYFPYQQLAKKLKEGSELLRTQFLVSFRKHRHSFLNAMFYKTIKNGKTNWTLYFSDADIQRASAQTIRTWGDMFALSNLLKDGKLSPKTFEVLQSKFSSIQNSFNQNTVRKMINDTTPYKEQIVDLLRSIKIDVDVKTIDKILTDKIKKNTASSDESALKTFINNELSYLFNNEGTLYKFSHSTEDKSKIELTPKTLFKNEKVVKTLAEAFVEVNPQGLTDTLPGPEGNSHYVYSDNSYVTDMIRDLREDNTVLDKLNADIFSRRSYSLKQINNDPNIRANLGVATLNAMIQDKTSDDGRGYLDISPIEDFLFKMMAYEKGYMAMPTLADRKSYYLPTGINLPKVRIIDGKINDEIIDIFYEYALAERDRIVNAKQLLKSVFKTNNLGEFVDSKGNVISEDNTKKVFIDPVMSPRLLINNYHYKMDGDTYNTAKGLAFKYQLFNSFNRPNFNFETDARTEIEKILNGHINKTIDMAKRLGIITSTMDNILMDNELVDERIKEYNDSKEAVKAILSNYTINTMIASIESMMLFSGDIAFYKPDGKNNPTDDFVKRLSVLTSSGALLRLDIPGEFETNDYTTTTFTQSEFRSGYYNLLHNRQKELLKKKYPERDDKFIEDLLKKYLKGYTEGKLDPTDAQVYITPEMHREISIRRGEWNPKKQKAFELLESTTPLTEEEEQSILDIVMQPLKYVYFDRIDTSTNNDTDKVIVPTYDKMSLATLFRRYVSGTHMEELLDRMEAKGKYEGQPKIHMAKYDTAVKAGKRASTELFTDVNTDTQQLTDLSTLALYTQNFRYLRHQVITDPHEHQETLLGTQAKKIGMANIVDDADYIVNGKSIKGSELKRNINKALSALSDKGVEELDRKLNVDKNGNIDEKSFQDMLYEEGKKSGLADNVLEALRIGITLDAMPERKWAFTKVVAMTNKFTIDTKLPGNQLIQLSGYGLGSTSMGNKYDKTNDLRFIFDDDANIKGIEAKISVSVFNEIFPESINTFEKKRQWLIDHPNVLEGLGYRIPTQGQNSMVAITVKEFLPEQLGDVIVLPNEFTALTGSDFDIDKLFFIRYNYSTDNKGNVTKIGLKDSTNLSNNSKAAIQNYLLDNYRSVLLSENNFLSTSTPLGSITNRLKTLAGEVTESETKTSRESLDFTTPVFQAAIKYKYSGGKFGVGPEALNNVHHIMCQIARLKFNYDLGIGLVDENGNTRLDGLYGLPESNGEEILISDWLSALIDAHVDIAKDPYIINLNVVRKTYNVANLLVRIGTGEKTFHFLPQPILKELVAESLNDDGDITTEKTQKPEEIVMDTYTKLAGVTKVPDGYNPFEDDLLSLINTPKSERDSMWYAKQVVILDKFITLDKYAAKWLSNLVMATRVDTKKYGSNPVEIKMYEDSVDRLIESNPFINLDKLITLDPNKIDESSFISTYHKNSIGKINQLFRDKTITVSTKFNQLIDNMLINMKRMGTNDESLVTHIADELHSAFLGKFFTDSNQLNLDTDKIKTIMSSVNTFVRDFAQTYPEIKDNYLLTSLAKGYTVEDGITFVGIPGIKADDNFTKEDLTYAWQELLKSSDPKVSGFAKQLLVYTFYTSGFKKGVYSLHHYIPAQLLKELEISYTDSVTGEKKNTSLNFNDFVKGLIEPLNTEGLNSIIDGVEDDVFKNNWYNNKYVPNINSPFKPTYYDTISNTKGEPLIIRTTLKSLMLGNNIDNKPVYKPYITVSIKDTKYLMEYVGYLPSLNNQAVYKLVSKRGYSSKGRLIKEYGLNKSIISSNNIDGEVTNDRINKITSSNPNYKSLVIMSKEERTININREASQVDNTISNINVQPSDISLNVGAEMTNLRDNIINDTMYSDTERQELLEVIDNTEVLNEEDLAELIEKICNKSGRKITRIRRRS